ncbi:MAG: hypothetical protein COB54_03990 [Alphaproteobacteria bacterium]|nr:MAG: hypothetical protein COB54_03990 [Alphaproteobacteria bacterium]
MRKTVSIAALVAGFSLLGMIGALDVALAKDITESRDLSSFEKIIIADTGVGLDVRVGKAFSVTLRGPEKWLSKITTRVEDNALVIGHLKKKKKSVNIDSDNRVIITMPKFTGLEVNGAVDADITGVDSENLTFEINGAGNIEIDGTCVTLNIDLNGAGNFEGEDLKCEDVKVEINGAGNVEVYGSNSADLEINGMGNIDLYGDPKDVSKEKSWFSNITIHDD